MKTLAIVGLIAALIFVSARLIHVENQRYALVTGMCRSNLAPEVVDVGCLQSVETRTSWLWHLYHGLGG